MTAPVLVRGSMRCPVPGCGGMLRPETNGMGRLIEICDLCVLRTQEHARFGGYFRMLERRIAALEQAALDRSPRQPRADEAPRRRSAPPEGAVRREGTYTALILDVLRAAPEPLSMRQILAAVEAARPHAVLSRVRAIIYNLAARRLILAHSRDHAVHGAPKRYTIAPPPASPSTPAP